MGSTVKNLRGSRVRLPLNTKTVDGVLVPQIHIEGHIFAMKARYHFCFLEHRDGDRFSAPLNQQYYDSSGKVKTKLVDSYKDAWGVPVSFQQNGTAEPSAFDKTQHCSLQLVVQHQ